MSHILIYATTDSRLHADLIVVRLKRAGIATSLLSVLYPTSLRPNSTRCWIRGSVPFALEAEGDVTVSGMLGLRLNALLNRWGRRSLVEGLSEIGLTHEQSVNVAESLRASGIVIAVEISDESDLPTVYHTLRGLAVEKVRTADSEIENQDLAASSRRYRRVYAATELALAHGSPA
jgi:hypothetical protein